jgi:predicted transcriptional regulator of viral defense system
MMNRLTEQFLNAPGGIFTIADVACVIQGSDFSRHGLIKRAIADGEILSIRRGLYCIAPRYRKELLSTYALAQRIYGPSYVSLESALAYHGWIPEAVHSCTQVSPRRSREFDTPMGIFSYSHVPQASLMSGVERMVDESGNAFYVAEPAKAIADYVYVRNPGWEDFYDASKSLRIEMADMMGVSTSALSKLVPNYGSRRIKQFLSEWLRALKS